MAVAVGNRTSPILERCGECSQPHAGEEGRLGADRIWYCSACWLKWEHTAQINNFTSAAAASERRRAAAAAHGPEDLRLAREEVLTLLGTGGMDEWASVLGARAEALDGYETAMLMAQGAGLMREGDVTKAQRCFAEAAFLQPLDPEASFNMGLYFEVAHRPDDMAKWMRRVLVIQPRHYMAQVLLGKYQERIGDYGGAMRTYRAAVECDVDPHLARGQIEQLVGDHKVSLDPMSAWPGAAVDILAEDPTWRCAFPLWQENFLHPLEDPPRTTLLEDGICVWDDVLGEPLLTLVADCVDDMSQFVTTNFWVTPGSNVTTCWLPREKTCPESAAELAIRLLMPRLLCEDPAEFCGVEWWAKMRMETRGQGLHYDQSEADDPALRCTVCGAKQESEWVHGNPWRPRWSSVLFLTDEGGPTAVVEQIHTRSDRNDPRCPQRGFLAMPKRGRYVVFRGDFFHGCMPVEHTGLAPRKIIVFNMWRSHRPPPNHCNALVYQRYPALRKLILTSEQICRAQAAEESRARTGKKGTPTPRERFATMSELPHSTRFGYMRFVLPMPSAARLKAGTGFYEFDWRAAAEDQVNQSECRGSSVNSVARSHPAAMSTQVQRGQLQGSEVGSVPEGIPHTLARPRTFEAVD